MAAYGQTCILAWITFFMLVAGASAQCDGTVLELQSSPTPGKITFPESGEYGTNLVCNWRITSYENSRILFKTENINIDCSDSLNIYDGSNDGAPAKETMICTTGATISKQIDTSSGRHLFVRFISDGSATPGKDGGFVLNYVSGPESPPPCTGALKAVESEKVIVLPSFPDVYEKNLMCVWEIEPTTSGAELVLVLTFRDIDGNTAKCFDFIKIGKEGEGGETHCGDEIFSDPRTFTIEGKARVEFKSDGIQEERGFVLTYKKTPPISLPPPPTLPLPPPQTTKAVMPTTRIFTRDELILGLINLTVLGFTFG